MRKSLTGIVLFTFIISTLLLDPAFANESDDINVSSSIEAYSSYMSENNINSEVIPLTEEEQQLNEEFCATMETLKEAYYKYFNDEISIEELQEIENQSFTSTSAVTSSNGLTTLAEGTKHREAIEKYKSLYKDSISSRVSLLPYNIGDYEFKRVGVSAESQIEGYYCGPATAANIINGYGKTYITQGTAADKLGTTTAGTGFGSQWLQVLNPTYTDAYYQVAKGRYGWAADLANRCITSIRNGHGVALNVVMNYNTTYLPGYGGGYEVRHYIAGCGFDSTDPSRRYVIYFDPNSAIPVSQYQKVSFQQMALATQTHGIIHAY